MNSFLGLCTVCLVFASATAVKFGELKLSPPSKELFVKTGDTLELECSVRVTHDKNNPIENQLEVDSPWSNGVGKYKHEKPSGNDVDVTVTDYIMTIKIKDLKRQHLGKYRCYWKTDSSVGDVSFTLSTPTEDKMTANFTYEDRPESVSMSCNLGGVASSKKITKVQWLKNDTLVTDLPGDRFIEVPENHTLVIEDPTRADADLYVARFTFEGMDTPYDCDVPFYAGPLVLKFDKSKNLIEDDNMELQCKVKGYPRAVVTWWKDDKVLNETNGPRIMQTPLDGYQNARLVIKNIVFEDAGVYRCIAHSDYFNLSANKTIVVRVKDKLAALWPFLGIVGEVVILCTIIFIYERRRNKQAENEANNPQDVDGSVTDKKEGLRHRNTQASNPTA